MSNDNIRRYGLIGAGMMGQEHIRSLALVEGAQLVAIAEPNDQPLQWTFETLKASPFGPAIYSDWREMVARTGPDAVIVATPNVMHHDMLVELMSGEMAIMAEQPLCTSLSDAQDIVKFAGQRQALTHMGLAYRYIPPVARFLERLDAGDVGTPCMLTIREHRAPVSNSIEGWNRFNDTSGGMLVAQCCHFFDLMRLVLRDEPVRIYASAGGEVNHLDETYEGKVPDMLDNAMVIVDFAKGARAHLDICMFADGSEQQGEISVVGEIGKLGVQIPAGVVTYSPRDKSGAQREEVAAEANILAASQHYGGTVYHLRDFHTALVTGDQAPIGAQDGLRAVEMALAAQESAATGNAVLLS